MLAGFLPNRWPGAEFALLLSIVVSGTLLGLLFDEDNEDLQEGAA